MRTGESHDVVVDGEIYIQLTRTRSRQSSIPTRCRPCVPEAWPACKDSAVRESALVSASQLGTVLVWQWEVECALASRSETVCRSVLEWGSAQRLRERVGVGVIASGLGSAVVWASTVASTLGSGSDASPHPATARRRTTTAARDAANLGLARIMGSVIFTIKDFGRPLRRVPTAELANPLPAAELAVVGSWLHPDQGQRVDDSNGRNHSEYRGKPPVPSQLALPDHQRGEQVGAHVNH